MFVVINHLHLDVPVSEIEAKLQSGADLLSTYGGFHAVYLTQEAEDRIAVIIVWETKEDAAAAAAAFGPTWFDENLSPYLTGGQVRTAGPVLASALA